MVTNLEDRIVKVIKELQETCEENCPHETRLRCRENGLLVACEEVQDNCLYTRQEIIKHILEPLGLGE